MYRTEAYYLNRPPPDIVSHFEDDWEAAWCEDNKDICTFMVDQDTNFGIRRLEDNEFVEIDVNYETSDEDE